MRKAQEEGEQLLQRFLHIARLHGGGVRVQARTVVPDVLATKAVGANLASFAEAHHADILVVGSRGLGAWQRQLYSLVVIFPRFTL